jgi:hypothetical protein
MDIKMRNMPFAKPDKVSIRPYLNRFDNNVNRVGLTKDIEDDHTPIREYFIRFPGGHHASEQSDTNRQAIEEHVNS